MKLYYETNNLIKYQITEYMKLYYVTNNLIKYPSIGNRKDSYIDEKVKSKDAACKWARNDEKRRISDQPADGHGRRQIIDRQTQQV